MKKIFLCLLMCGCSIDTDEIFGTFPGEIPDGGGGMGGDSDGGNNTGGESEGGKGGTNTGGDNQGGNSGSGGNNTCTPKTCATIAVELNQNNVSNPIACGNHEDGCGNYINCNFSAQLSCELPWQRCGGKSLTNPQNFNEFQPGIGTEKSGLCGGNCLLMSNDMVNQCPGKRLVKCYYPTDLLPNEGLGIDESQCQPANGETESDSWCCPL